MAFPEKTPKPPPRRQFFAEGLRALFGGAEQIADALRRVAPLLTGRNEASHAASSLLRPPGARPEVEFSATCERSGRCIAACPVQALIALRSADPQRNGTPYLVPSQRACVVCDDLSCMKACPSGALTLVPKEEIRIGLAQVAFDLCRRTAGDPCRECIERCPLGAAAIALDAHGRVEVKNPGCIGCGVCELYCPTTPRAITIHSLVAAH